MKETFELSDGRAVTVKSAWDCDKSVSLIGEMPDFDDEDFNVDKVVREVEEEISWAENY